MNLTLSVTSRTDKLCSDSVTLYALGGLPAALHPTFSLAGAVASSMGKIVTPTTERSSIVHDPSDQLTCTDASLRFPGRYSPGKGGIDIWTITFGPSTSRFDGVNVHEDIEFIDSPVPRCADEAPPGDGPMQPGNIVYDNQGGCFTNPDSIKPGCANLIRQKLFVGQCEVGSSIVHGGRFLIGSGPSDPNYKGFQTFRTDPVGYSDVLDYRFQQ